MGGQQPVQGARIQLYAAGTNGDAALATALLTAAVSSDAGGNFSFSGLYQCPSPGSLVYLTATGGNPGLGAGTDNAALALMTAVGRCDSITPSTFVTVNERTTVAAVWTLAPFMNSPAMLGSSPIDLPGLTAAFAMVSAYVDRSTGAVPGPGLPQGGVAPVQQINTLADVLAACVNSPGGTAGDGSSCGGLLQAATPPAGTAPLNTIGAALNIARDPTRNVGSLFNLSTAFAPFQPQLGAAPVDWSVAPLGNVGKAVTAGCTGATLTGAAAFTDFSKEQAGVCRELGAADLPAPYATGSTTNYSTLVPRASGQMPVVPAGFKVTLYASGLGDARFLLPAANGDLLLAQPASGSIVILRGVDGSGHAASQSTFAAGLSSPYGLAFYPSASNPQYLYVANETTVERFPYQLGNTVATAAPTILVTGLPSGGHSTRTIAFTAAGSRLLVSVGSQGNLTNTDTDSSEFHRADVLAYAPDGTFEKVYASGLRNAVGLTLDPSGTVWASVNERDGLGDNLPADYVTHVVEDGFYGWPWYYNGPNADPRLPLSHVELAVKVLVGDTLLQPHFAPLQIAFYTGGMFPLTYKGDLFVASHGSWNKAVRGGYELVRVPIRNGVATGEHEDFMTGFVNADGSVWGRPAGVAMGADGALYVADDGSNSVWRITYTGSQ